MIAAAALAGFDFLDFGASKGGVIEFAQRRLGGRRGLGIDLDPRKVEQMRARGLDCIEGDVTALDLPAGCVRFVTMSHVLEHLRDAAAVGRALAGAARVAREFLFVQGPFFEADAWLRRRGLKFFWSDWHGHPCAVTAALLRGALAPLEVAQVRIGAHLPVLDSGDPSLHAVASPRDQHEHDARIHPPKPALRFEPPLYKELVAVVALPGFRGLDQVWSARRGLVDEAEWRDRWSGA